MGCSVCDLSPYILTKKTERPSDYRWAFLFFSQWGHGFLSTLQHGRLLDPLCFYGIVDIVFGALLYEI
ncbi:MAG: hypothetical protein COW89_06175 [Nitrospinae bacterium CG22_combo_CG10-13_8_21_14_all_47_10]|nr:MAG: hypothetical protein COW89_06175 [Nitrospinae bacterium CG22_combo_CG10-13_8_21_14_all_47_10]